MFLDLQSCRRVRSPACCSLARVSGWRMWTGTALPTGTLTSSPTSSPTQIKSNCTGWGLCRGEGEEGRACLGWGEPKSRFHPLVSVDRSFKPSEHQFSDLQLVVRDEGKSFWGHLCLPMSPLPRWGPRDWGHNSVCPAPI